MRNNLRRTIKESPNLEKQGIQNFSLSGAYKFNPKLAPAEGENPVVGILKYTGGFAVNHNRKGPRIPSGKLDS